MIISENELEVM